MHTPIDRRAFLQLAGPALAGPAWAAGPPPVPIRQFVIGHPEAAAAGQDVLATGGNAVDAVVAAALVAGVVAVPSCGIAGYGGCLVVASPTGKVTAIDFNTTAPAAARADMFSPDATGKVKGQVNAYGWLASGVPGTLAGLQLALDRHGTRRFADVVKPAVRWAREGFAVSKGLARAIVAGQARLRRDPGSAKLFFRKDQPLAAGDRFRNPDLANLLEKLAERGSVESFYRGDVARRIAEAFAANKGLVTIKDLAAYRAREVAPLKLDWQGWTIHTAPLTAGGLTILQVIATLKALDWSKWDQADFRRTHARLEALRIAWHDRLRWLGDPAHADVPVERLLSERHARLGAARVRQALEKKKPLSGDSDGRSDGGTIHLTAVDARGMMAALTLTHGDSFGAQVTVDGLGLILGQGMSRFDPRPGQKNSPGPGKRPLHNMCPTIASRDGKPVLALGAVGGRRIPNTIFDVLTRRMGEGKSLADAVAAPRMHSEGDLQTTIEAAWPAAEVKRLKEMGYQVRNGPGARLNAIERDPRTGTLQTAAR